MELQFRIGVTHGAHWFRSEAEKLAKEGRSAREIADRLRVLEQVLLRWRTALASKVEGLPDDNPWEWSEQALETYIDRM